MFNELNLSVTILIVVCISSSEALKESVVELCLWEAFKPECSSNEVVFVEDAKYGRMNVGRCLAQSEIDSFGSQSKDQRFFGCYHDVTDFLSRNCSLEKQCEMKVGIFEERKIDECLPGLKMYLEVKYLCLPVIDQLTTGCNIFLGGTPKYLSITPKNNILCGTDSNPLLIEVSKGQRISLNVKPLKESETLERRECQKQIGTIIDRKSQINATICDNGIYNPSSRSYLSNGFVSKGNHISVVLKSFETRYKALLDLKADGCLDIIPPEDTWLKRTNDDIVIGCYSSKQTWYLRCENGQWTGSIGNCSNPETFKLKPNYKGQNAPTDDAGVTNEKLNLSSTQQTFIIIAIGAFGVIVCLAIVCLGMIYLKRMAHKQVKNQSHYSNGTDVYSGNSGCGHFDRLQRANGFSDPAMVSSTFNKQTLLSMPPNADLEADERYQVLDKDEVAKECGVFN